MSPEKWKKLSAALDQLLDLPEGEQAQFLQKLRADDPRLCQEVESLLKQRHPTERLEAPPPQLLEALRPTGGDGAAPLAARGQAASKFPETARYEALGRLLDQQRESWGRGEQVLVEALLEGHPTLTDDRERLLDLVWNEVDLRAARGETPRLEEYQQRFPALSDDLRRQFEVFAAIKPTDRTLAWANRRADGAGAGSSDPSGATPSVPWRLEGYEILEKLGQGGMGVVCKALQVRLNRVVALKMILGGEYADEQELARFKAEAEAVARLQHPNIVQIHEVGEGDGRPFLVLEYVEGGSLAGRLNGTPWSPRDAAALVETLARAVHAAHLKHIVHRDLKPANVLLTADGTPKITDFGLAKRLDAGEALSQTGQVMGTPSYMPPEQAAARRSQVGPASDVYSLGAILYELLTGRPPFKGPTALDTLQQVLHDDPAPPRQLQSKTPRDLETICLKCLQKDPQKRYASAAALAEDLRRYQAGEPIAARPVGRLERGWRWGRRNPKDAALVAAGLAAVVLGVVAYLWIAGVRQAAEQDRRDRQGQATTRAERKLTDANLLWVQAKTAAVGELHPWEDALSAAHQVKDYIDENAVDESTRRRVEQTLADVAAAKQEAETKAAIAAKDKRMKDELNKLAFNLEPVVAEQGGGFVANDPDYEQAFARYGIDLNQMDSAEARIRASAIKPELVAALDAWIPLLDDAAERRRIADLANRVSEPNEFLHKVREALVKQDEEQLRRLAKQDMLPLGVVYDLALDLSGARAFEEGVELLRPAQQRNPGDFAINFYLAYCVGKLKPPRLDEQTRFYTAAVAIQPKNSTAHNSLANALSQQGRLDEAVAEYRTANQLDPTNANALTNLRILLPQLGKLCLYTRRPAAAARLFQEAFTMMAPGQAPNYRFEAAQAAAQTGVGDLPDAASLTEEQRAGWRTQARDWLRADFPALAKRAESDKAEDRQAAAQQLRLWQTHVAFAGLRDEAELKKLPQDEQTAWRQFWTDVAAAVDRAEKR